MLRLNEKFFKKLSCILIVGLLNILSIFIYRNSYGFVDVDPSDPNYGYAYSYIQAIAEKGITKGCNPPTNDRYCPGDFTTRAQMAAFIIRALEGEPQPGSYNSNPYFSDVPPNHWAFKYIQRIYERGIAQGYSTTPPTFGPDAPITREQMAKMLIRALISQGKEVEPPDDYCSSGAPFLDVQTDRWSCKYIKKVKELGITTGYSDGTYKPQNLVDRSQMAVFIGRAFLGLKEGVRTFLQGFSFVLGYNEELEIFLDISEFLEGLYSADSAKLTKTRAILSKLKTQFSSVNTNKISLSNQLKSLAPFLLKAKTTAKTKAEVHTEQCPYGGSMNISSSGSDTNFDITLIANECSLTQGEVINGKLRIYGSETSFTAEFGDTQSQNPFTIKGDCGYTKFLITFNYPSISYGSNNINFKAIANGNIEIQDTEDNEYFKGQYNNFQIDISFTYDTTTTQLIATVNGNVIEQNNFNFGKLYTYKQSFENFNLMFKESSSYDEFSIKGIFGIQVEPKNVCLGGRFSYNTEIPIKFNYFTNTFTQGRLVITELNSNSQGILTFNSNGTLTVTAGGISETYSRYNWGSVPGICYL